MPSPYRQRLATILVLGLAMRLLFALVLPPGYDESYYLFYGQHLALSYFDHPLAIGLWSWLGNLLGGGILALRLPVMLSYTLATALLAEATRRSFGPSAALLSAALATLSPLLLVGGGLLLLPDSPLLLVLSLLIAWLAHHPLSQTSTLRQNLVLGGILGLLTLCKYQAFLLIASLLLLRLHQSWRQRAWRPAQTLAVFSSWLLVSSPLWIWNLTNGWASLAFQTGRTSTAHGFQPFGPLLFGLSQFGLIFPTVAVALIAALAADPRRHPVLARQQEWARTLRWMVFPQLLMFALLAGRMQVLQTWLLPAWWLTLPLAGAVLQPAWERRQPGLRRAARLTLVLVPLLCLLAAGHVRWGLASALLPSSVDTSTELMEPAELRRSLQQDPAIWQALTEAEVIASNRYELPGFLALALRGRSQAHYTVISRDPRGFHFWRHRIPTSVARGVFYLLHSDAGRIATLQANGQLEMVRPLGSVNLMRGGQPALRLDFFSFDPARSAVHGPTQPASAQLSPTGPGAEPLRSEARSRLTDLNRWPSLYKSAALPLS